MSEAEAKAKAEAGAGFGGRTDAAVVDVTAESSGEDVAEVVDVPEDSCEEGDREGEGDVAEESAPGAPPLRFHGYRRGRELGRGASGQVFLCTRRGCRGGFAVKAVDLRKMRLSPHVEREQKKLRREVEILKSLPPHPHIVQLVDAYAEGDWFLLVLELVGGGDLYTVLTSREPARLLEPEAAFVLAQLTEGLSFLHGQHIIHRDLKLENVLVASAAHGESGIVLYRVKIADFGLSKTLGVGLSEALSTVGTHPYIAPEVMNTRSYDFSSDLWCLGVLVYVLLAGHFPFESMGTDQANVDRVVVKLAVSEAAKSVVQGLLHVEPSARLCLQELSTHRWLQDTAPRKRRRQPSNEPQSRPATRVARAPPAPLTAGGRPVPPAPPMPSLDSDSGTPLLHRQQTVPKQEVMPDLEKEVDSALVPGLRLGGAPGSGFGSGSASGSESDLPGKACFGLGLGPQAASDLLAALRCEIRPGNEQPDVLQVRMLFAESPAALASLSNIARTANCEVWLSGSNCVAIAGKFSNCALAQELVLQEMLSKTAEHDPSSSSAVVVVLLVRAEAAGIVIGKQGFCIQQIQEQSGASIELLRWEVEGQRPCILKGELPSVLLAQKHIAELVCAVPLGLGGSPIDGVAPTPTPVSEGAACTRLLLTSDCVAAVTGQSGLGLRQIRQRCGVKVQMMPCKGRAPGLQDGRVLTLRGPISGRQEALGTVLELIRAPTTTTGTAAAATAGTLQLLVPAAQIQRLLDDAALRQDGCVALQCQKDGDGEGDAGEEDHQLLVVRGPCEKLLRTAAAVLEVLES